MAAAVPYTVNTLFPVCNLTTQLKRVDDADNDSIYGCVIRLRGKSGRGTVGNQDQIPRPCTDRIHSNEWLASHIASRIRLADDEQFAPAHGFIFDRCNGRTDDKCDLHGSSGMDLDCLGKQVYFTIVHSWMTSFTGSPAKSTFSVHSQLRLSEVFATRRP